MLELSDLSEFSDFLDCLDDFFSFWELGEGGDLSLLEGFGCSSADMVLNFFGSFSVTTTGTYFLSFKSAGFGSSLVCFFDGTLLSSFCFPLDLSLCF